MDNSKNTPTEHLGVNKMGKNIRKSPLHQPNFGNTAAKQQPQPQVYNISKNDFRNIVQQLTGSPSHDPLPRPPQNPPKPQSMRLQRIRPPPLTPINRPQIPPPAPVPVAPPPVPYMNSLARPAQLPPWTPGDSFVANTAESPTSAYMRYLQSSMISPSPREFQPQHPVQPHFPGHIQGQPPTSGLLPNPHVPALTSPRMNGHGQPMANFQSPRANAPTLLPSPTSQFLLPSPTGYLNMSPYPLLSPGIQFSPLLTPNFSFSPLAQSGILGPGPHPPPSPGLAFPFSPSGFFPVSSPRWRGQ